MIAHIFIPSVTCPGYLESYYSITDGPIKTYKLTVKFQWYLFFRVEYHTVTLLHFLPITMILFECSPSAFANNNFTTPSHGLQLMTWALGHDTASACSVLDLHWSLQSGKCKYFPIEVFYFLFILFFIYWSIVLRIS